MLRRLISAAAGLAALAVAAPARADLTELKWASEGYFRTRTVMLTNLAPQPRLVTTYAPTGEQLVIPDIRSTSYIMSRLRLMPSLQFGKQVRLNFQIDALDDVLWGDNNGLSTAPLFATDGSNQGYLGGPVGDSVTIRRAWVQFPVPVGVMRVGRMPSHWGMGLLANGGGTGWIDPETPKGEPQRRILDNFFDDDFGDNHFGSTADRILFITKPITIYRTLAKKGKVEHPLVVGYAFDKLSESPLLPFENFERKFRPFGQQGFISRGKNDDVDEHVVLAVWNDPDWDKKSFQDELRVGVYGVLRLSDEGSTNPSALDPANFCGEFEDVPQPCVDTGSAVWIADLWWRIRYGKLMTEGEAYYIGGETFGGVPFPSANRKKEAGISAGVARFAWLERKYDAVLEVGHASGDDELEDEHFKQRAIHPDFNVGLILFEETLRELTARVYGVPFFSTQNPQGALGLMSNGGVINANYVFPKARFRPTPVADTEITAGVLMAWVDTLATAGTALFRACSGANGECAPDETASKYLGTEFDLGIKASFAGNMRASLEAGLLLFGDALKKQLTEASSSFTFQSSIAFVW